MKSTRKNSLIIAGKLMTILYSPYYPERYIESKKLIYFHDTCTVYVGVSDKGHNDFAYLFLHYLTKHSRRNKNNDSQHRTLRAKNYWYRFINVHTYLHYREMRPELKKKRKKRHYMLICNEYFTRTSFGWKFLQLRQQRVV